MGSGAGSQGSGMTARGSNPDLVAIATLAVTVEEAARLLSISRASLYKLVMRGEIESFTVGRARRIALLSLDAYVRQVSAAGRSGSRT